MDEDTREDSAKTDEKMEFLPGYSDVNEYSKATLQAAFQATKASNAISSTEDESKYNRTFENFRKFMRLEGKNVLKLMSTITKHHGGKITYENLDDDDIFEKLIEVNDSILEEAGIALDEAAGLRKKVDDVVLTTVRITKPIATSWNRKAPTTPPVYTLLGGKNVQRPQFKFKDKIDNSKGPFIPIIKEKPNSLKPLAILLEKIEDEEIYTHPYEIEIDKFQPSEDHLKVVEPQFPKSTNEFPFKFVETIEDLNELLHDLKKVTEFAVDLEHHSYRTFLGITCLMQISTRFKDYVIDVLELRSELYLLNEVFTDAKIVKVFHGANSDVQWLQRDFGIYVVNMFDTGQAAAVLQFPHLSLAYLMKHYCQFEPDKQIRLADWRIRPIPPQMMNYARDDTHYLLYIYDRMKKDLIEKGNERKNLLLSVFQKSKEVCLIRYRKPYSFNDSHTNLYVKSKKMFNNRQLFALRELFNWRDALARVEDESIGYVLPNHMLLQIAEVLPREQQGILACCNPIPPLVRTQLNEIHAIVLKARQCPAHKLEIVETIAETSANKHETYNEESNLNLSCPHDIPPQDSTLTKLPTLLDENLSINRENVSIQLIKTKPSLSIFGLTTKEIKTNDENLSLIKNVLNSFVSPYERFKTILETKTPADDHPKSAMDKRVERVHQHFKELVSKTPENVEEIEIPEKDNREKSGEGDHDDEDDDIEVIEPIKDNSASGKRKKRKKETETSSVTIDFKPFDYSAVSQTPDKEEGAKRGGRGKNNNRGRKRKSFNPHEEVEYKSDKGSTSKKRRGQKDQSLTYGSNSTTRSSRNWPKR